VATDKGIRLAVLRADGDGCTLALNVMRRSGGSLVIESQAASDPITFRVHWAGERTSDDGADCGPRADLTVRRHHLDLLASYAGGYGAGPERAAVYAPAMLQ
jgi:hypothetical protein